MSDKKPKLTQEQQKAMKALQSMLAQGAKGKPGGAPGAGGAPGSLPPELMQKLAAAAGKGGMPPAGLAPQKPPIYTPKGFFIATMIAMQNSVKFLDQFTNFIINRKTPKDNDVLSKSRSPIIFGFWIIFIFVFLGSIWAGTAPLDSAASAIGVVVSDSKKRIINHSEGGIIKKIYVEVGDEIKPGDKLMEFDDSKVKSEYEAYRSQYRTALATEARLTAEVNNDDSIEYSKILLQDQDDPEVKKLIETQDNLFTQKNESINSEIDSYKQRVVQFEKQIEGLKARKGASKKSLEIVKDRLDATKKLHKQGYAQKAALLELEDREAKTLSEIAITDSEIARTEQQITESEIGIVNVKSKSLANALTEIKDIQSRLPELRQRYEELSARLERMIVISRVEGIVNKVENTTIGSTVSPYGNILEISPKNDKLVIEAKISPKHIDSILVGQVSKINFSAFKSRISPVFVGEVVWISPDVIFEPNKPVQDKDFANGHYLAHIDLDKEDFDEKAIPRGLSIRPGMQAEVQIVTGERTLLRYLLDPVFDAMFKGLKEK